MPTNVMVMNGMWVFIILVIWAAKVRVVDSLIIFLGASLNGLRWTLCMIELFLVMRNLILWRVKKTLKTP